MDLLKTHGFVAVISLVLLKAISCEEVERETCNPKPFQSNFEPLPPDNRFVIEIEDITDEFMPGKTYKVILSSKDAKAEFVAFTISATGSTMPDVRNPRKEFRLQAGNIDSSGDSNVHDTIKHVNCPNTVIEADKQPKNRVVAQWKAPPAGNQCVTIWAYVAVKPDVWYTNIGPLAKKVCEDTRQKADMKPKETRNCRVCQDARYELEFQGTWSLNTHLNMYPNSSSRIVRFSDIVGASHAKGFVLYDEQSVASQGLKMLAEQGNTTLMERDILKDLPSKVRTVIKANGPYNSTSSTITSFRMNWEKHFISLVASVIPSSDWFVGVINMELCEEKGWIPEYVYNLYPMDAGTDSGEGFEVAPEPTTPPQPIKKVRDDKSQEKTKPFAKLKITLIRVYDRDCDERTVDTTPTESGDSGTESPMTWRPPPSPPPVTYSSVPPSSPEGQDPDKGTESPTGGCKTTDFGSFTQCEGACENGVIVGYQVRNRNFIDKEDNDRCPSDLLFEVQNCKEPCDDDYDIAETTLRDLEPQSQS